MFELKPFDPKSSRPQLERPRTGREPKQRRMMVFALTLLLVALGFALYHDRDFWFPDAQEALEPESGPAPGEPAATAPAQTVVAKASPPVAESAHPSAPATKPPARARVAAVPQPAANAPSPDTPPGAVITRTVLPPLEVEVLAGDVHRAVHPGNNSVRVDLQPGEPPQAIPDLPSASVAPQSGANLTNASDRVQVSADASEIVSHPVRPGYPMLARQMKVQGSVILQALISRDGAIQDLQVMSGPPILAGAAREAVKQWRFKPHYLGAETVETQARITVNFTISTN